MAFESVDALQRTLAETVFQYAADRKKAAGRALGTLVEIITFYTLHTWNLRDHVVIERSVPEFANPDILHNVEFSLHPIQARHEVKISPLSLPLTAAKIKRHLPFLDETTVKSTQALSRDAVKRNAAVLVESETGPVIANVDTLSGPNCRLTVCELSTDPFAIFECKRVGVEEGMKKGPQTIEKAKQGLTLHGPSLLCKKCGFGMDSFKVSWNNPTVAFEPASTTKYSEKSSTRHRLSSSLDSYSPLVSSATMVTGLPLITTTRNFAYWLSHTTGSCFLPTLDYLSLLTGCCSIPHQNWHLLVRRSWQAIPAALERIDSPRYASLTQTKHSEATSRCMKPRSRRGLTSSLPMTGRLRTYRLIYGNLPQKIGRRTTRHDRRT